MNLKYTLVAAAALATLSTTASAVDWDGYFRVGPGGKSPNDCYDLGAFGSDGLKYRLGNECNTYGEFGLGQKARLGNVDVKAYLMTNWYQPGSDVGSQKVGIEQMYAEAKGFDVAPDQTFWVGQRFYGRNDVHIVDTFFVNMTGTGAGVDGFDLGGGAKLNLAVFRNDTSNYDGTGNFISNPNLTRFNADLLKLPLNPGGTLRITGTITHGTNLGTNGSGISFQHNQDGILGGANTLWLQFAKGSAGLNAGNGSATDTSAVKQWRIVESMQWVTGPLTGQALAVYANHKDNTGMTTTDSTVGGRMAYALTNNFKLQGELGFSRIKPDGAQTESLTKFTIAPTLTVGPNFYDRPEFRLYATFAHLNDAAVLASQVPFGNGYTKNTNHSFGVQVEMWF